MKKKEPEKIAQAMGAGSGAFLGTVHRRSSGRDRLRRGRPLARRRVEQGRLLDAR